LVWLRASKADFEKDELGRQEQQVQLEQAIQESEGEKLRLEAAKDQEQKALNDAMTRNIGAETGVEAVRPITAKTKKVQIQVEKPAKTDNATVKAPTLPSPPKAVDALGEAAVRARAEYLRTQRDKLLALKKAEREKQFQVSLRFTARQYLEKSI
jgi:hypothetical protein